MNTSKSSAGGVSSEKEDPVVTILAVDDNPNNLAVISEHLKQCGYRVLVARDGESAVERAEYGKPDLILLDVLMPGLDGYETCRKLKESELLRGIPVIFMTALAETADKVKAFQSGGVDYITKPFQQEEMLARVETHVMIAKQRKDLRESYEKLEALQNLKDDLMHMIVHDLRSPIWGVQGYLELFKEMEVGLSDEGRQLIDQLTGITSSLQEMVSSILDVRKMEAGAMSLCLAQFDLEGMIRSVFVKLGGLKKERRLELLPVVGERPACITADEGLIERTIENLIGNAVKFTREDDGEIVVGIEILPDVARFFVRDNGYGVPEEHRDLIFEKFGQVTARRNLQKYSTGLGLSFCKLVVEAHGGRIWLGEDEENRGSVFHVELPRHGPSNDVGECGGHEHKKG